MKAGSVVEGKGSGGRTSPKRPSRVPAGGSRAKATTGSSLKAKPAGRKDSRETSLRSVASLLETDDPIKKAIITRTLRAIAHALHGATTANLEQALQAPTDAGSAARLLSIIAGSEEAVRELDPTAAAILRGARMKQDLLERAGGVFEAVQVADLLGITRAAVTKRARNGSLLAIPDASGRLQFPAIQFTDAGAVPGLKEVLAAFNVDSPWTRLALLLDTDEAVGGGRIIDALRSGELQKVLDVVRSFGA